MEWYQANRVDYVFGLPGSKPLAKKIDEAAGLVRTERAVSNKPVVRGYAETRTRPNPGTASGAPSPASKPPRSGSTPASSSPTSNTARRNGFTTPSIARAGRPEKLINLNKTQIASDRTSCRSAVGNQVRLVLHTAAYWLMLTVRDAIPKPRDLANAEFSTLRLRLIKIAARVIETASRVRPRFRRHLPGGRSVP